MSDVSTWDPLDSNNTAAPPDGWPEFMMPSQVNNSARAIMGAVRRMYDQQVNGSLVLPYLPLSGGTVNGTVTINGGLITTAINASGNIASSGSISAGATITAGSRVTASNGELFGSGWALTGSGGSLNIGTGVAGNLGQLTLYATAVSAVGSLSANGQISGGSLNSGGGITASGNITCGSFNSGNITVTGVTVASGGSLSVTGNVSVTGTVSGGALSISGTATADVVNGNSSVNGNFVHSNGNIDAAGQYTGGSMNLGGEVRGGSLATGGAASIGGVATVHDVLPSSDFTGVCGGASQGWHDVVSYNYVTLSDAALKTDLGPLPDTLALVSAIEPQAFRYGGDDERHWGFVAQDVRAAIGDLPVDVVRGEEGHLGVDYGAMTAMLWKAVQSLAAKVQQLEETNV